MNMEVLKLVAHLIITIILILSYATLLFIKGVHDQTLQLLLVAAVGYWFGAVPIGGKNNDKQQ
jgi:hypothetical protein